MSLARLSGDSTSSLARLPELAGRGVLAGVALIFLVCGLLEREESDRGAGRRVLVGPEIRGVAGGVSASTFSATAVTVDVVTTEAPFTII